MNLALCFYLLYSTVTVSHGTNTKQQQSSSTSSSSAMHLPTQADPTRNLVIITDMEPDDRIALAVVAARMAPRVLCIGTTVLNAARKAELARHALAQTPLAEVPVCVGTGGTAKDYPVMNSTKASLEYGDKEGQGILDEQTLGKLNDKNWAQRLSEGVVPNEFQARLKELLTEALRQKVPVEVLAIAPPTDLVAMLALVPVLRKAIARIHLMGGWVEVRNTAGQVTRRKATYNVNMDGRATAKLLEMANRGQFQVILYSSHVIEAQFEGGSVNQKQFPELISAIMNSKAPGLRQFHIAGLSWDTNLVAHYRRLRTVVGPFAGEQFTPSDPLPVVGILNPKLAKREQKVRVEVAMPEGLQEPPQGYPVRVEECTEDEESGITLVEEFDMGVFREEMIRSIEQIDAYENQRLRQLELEQSKDAEFL